MDCFSTYNRWRPPGYCTANETRASTAKHINVATMRRVAESFMLLRRTDCTEIRKLTCNGKTFVHLSSVRELFSDGLKTFEASLFIYCQSREYNRAKLKNNEEEELERLPVLGSIQSVAHQSRPTPSISQRPTAKTTDDSTTVLIRSVRFRIEEEE